MRVFLKNSESAYHHLEAQAKQVAFVNFPNKELPPGCVPTHGRIGLKIDRRSGAATLYVERGIVYHGANQTIRRWIREGQLTFSDFPHLRNWICTELKIEFDDRVQTANSTAKAVDVAEPPMSESNNVCAAHENSENTKDLDASLRQLLNFLIKQSGGNYGVEVCSIDSALVEKICERLRVSDGKIPCDTVVDDLLGGSFAFAAVQGHRKIRVCAGPPITCIPDSDASRG